MEIFPITAFFLFVLILGIVIAFAAVHVTRNFNRGRGGIVVAAFFSPFLFVGYLLVAGYLRNEFHYDRREVSNLGGNCTLPLNNGYSLIYFDEMPSASSIGEGDWRKPGSVVVSDVQKVVIAGDAVLGQTSSSSLPDGPVDFFFALDLTSGEIKKFGDEASLRKFAPQAGPLRSPDEVFRLVETRERSILFWPVAASLPSVLSAVGMYVRRQARKTKPALDDSNAGS